MILHSRKLFCSSKPKEDLCANKGTEQTLIRERSGSVVECLTRDREAEPHRRHCVMYLSKNINLSLVPVQPRKTRPFITERFLMDANNQIKQTILIRQMGPQVCYKKHLVANSSPRIKIGVHTGKFEQHSRTFQGLPKYFSTIFKD